MKEHKFIIKRGISDRNERQLILNEKLMSFEDKDYIYDAFTTFQSDEIIAFRYGIKWISIFGYVFQIFIKNVDNKQIKIDFATYFHRNKSNYFENYQRILNALWELYFLNISNEFIQKFQNETEFGIANVFFNATGISYKSGVMNSTEIEIPWEKIRTFNYQRHFVIAHSDNQGKISKQFSYLDDWNVSVLYSVIRTILQEKGIESYD